MNPNGYTGGNGGGSNWTALTTGNFNTKREFQTSHSITGSVTKVRGKWVHKAGMEFRNLLSNYADPEQGSVAMPSPFAHQGGNFNFQYITASGGVASLVTRPTRSAASTPPACCSARACGGFGRART